MYLCSFIIQCYYLTQTLTTLILYLNQIGDQGAQYLADVLQINTVRQFFYLNRYLSMIIHHRHLQH